MLAADEIASVRTTPNLRCNSATPATTESSSAHGSTVPNTGASNDMNAARTATVFLNSTRNANHTAKSLLLRAIASGPLASR
jgi:hypothetical protein